LFGQPASWLQRLQDAGVRAGDRLSVLPIYEEARDELRSEIADFANQVTGPGGAITAAAFLREFVGDEPWAHLDIAGTAWSDAKRPYQAKGPTGVIVRTLIELAESLVRR
jgi:leucyl aminopeptidase